MATTGRKPLPTNLLPFTGGKARTSKKVKEREKNGAIELPTTPAGFVPDAPDWLSPAGVTHWNKTVSLLQRMRIISEADVDALAMYIESYERWRDATAQVRKLGMILKSPSGYPIQNPMLAIANKAQEQCLKILVEFGLTPSSRTRVNREKG